MTTATVAAPRFASGSLGRSLEDERLEHRRRRLERVIRVLRAQRRAAPCPGVQAALEGFEAELREVQGRLRASETGR